MLCVICRTRPIKGRERCQPCLVYFRRHGRDRTHNKIARQHARAGIEATAAGEELPKGLPDEAVAAITAAKAREALVRWLMAADTDHELPTLEVRPPWMARAACRGQPVELFFPGRGQSAEPARAICARCPVRVLCEEYAVEESWLGMRLTGIWGGTSERQRRRTRREQLADAG